MILVNSLPTVEPDRQHGWRLIFWMGDPFDYATPFRPALAEIVDVLGRQSPSSVRLPDYEAGEDFVEGSLEFGGRTLRIYYEHSLGFLELTSSNADMLREVASRLGSCLKVIDDARPLKAVDHSRRRRGGLARLLGDWFVRRQ
jgi:hypothetical protein